MAAKKALALRIDDMELEALHRLAEARGISMTRLLMEGVSAQARNMDLQNEIKQLQEQQAELLAKYKAQTGKRLQTTRRVTIPLTEPEWQNLRRAAYEHNTTKSQLLRKECVPYLQELGSRMPALEQVEMD